MRLLRDNRDDTAAIGDKDIAAVLNANFVAIKVDRERRPEVDETYMIATEMLNQAGGWPNNVFLTPELKPFAAVTYLPKPQFKELMASGGPEEVLRRLRDKNLPENAAG